MMMVTPGCVSGLPALPIAGDAAVLQADIGLVDARVVDDQRVGDDRIDRALGARRLALAHAVADDLAAAELHLLAIGGEVLLHLDEEFGVGEPHLVADGRAEHLGIGGAGDAGHQTCLPCRGPPTASLHISAAIWPRNNLLADGLRPHSRVGLEPRPKTIFRKPMERKIHAHDHDSGCGRYARLRCGGQRTASAGHTVPRPASLPRRPRPRPPARRPSRASTSSTWRNCPKTRKPRSMRSWRNAARTASEVAHFDRRHTRDQNRARSQRSYVGPCHCRQHGFRRSAHADHQEIRLTICDGGYFRGPSAKPGPTCR